MLSSSHPHPETLFWHSFWHTVSKYNMFNMAYLFWHSIWHSFRHSIWPLFWHSIWHLFRHSFCHSFWHSFWYSINLASILWHSFWHSIWHSLWRLAEVQQCPLNWDLELAVERPAVPTDIWRGPAVPTAVWSSRLRSGSAHWDLELLNLKFIHDNNNKFQLVGKILPKSYYTNDNLWEPPFLWGVTVVMPPLQTIIQPESGCCLHLHHHIANLKSDHFVNAAGNHPKTSQLQTFWWFLGWFPSHTTNSCWHGEYEIPGKKKKSCWLHDIFYHW